MKITKSNNMYELRCHKEGHYFVNLKVNLKNEQHYIIMCRKICAELVIKIHAKPELVEFSESLTGSCNRQTQYERYSEHVMTNSINQRKAVKMKHVSTLVLEQLLSSWSGLSTTHYIKRRTTK